MGVHPWKGAADVVRFASVVALLCAPGCRTDDESSSLAGHEIHGLVVAASAPEPEISPTHASAAIAACLAARDTASGAVHSGQVEADLTALYGTDAPAPQWLDASGRPDSNAQALLTLLARAGDEGLDATAYAYESLAHRAATLVAPDAATLRERACFDVALSRSILTFVRHLHLGRVAPRSMGFNLVIPPEPHDFATVVREARAANRVADLRDALVPQLPQYEAMRQALARYRALATGPALPEIPTPVPSVKPGDSWVGAAALRVHLTTRGDLSDVGSSETEPADEGRYEGALVDGVRRFQARHGLEADGVIGRATHEALLVPLSWRVRQIVLALERLRWLPDFDDRRLLLVNIPMFQLWGWNATLPGERPAVGMRAIVGRALSTETPVFVADLREVVFMPYWNVPSSILRNEILPRIARDAGYLERENMEVVRGAGDNAQRVALTDAAVAGLRSGALRVRQRPGPRNALGRVKFLFPNSADVYMHDTPAQALFSRARRDFSHGCVRVEEPGVLAQWVLREQPDWTPARIEAAMNGPGPRTVSVARPVRVVLFYTTAAVTPRDGTLHFAADIYRHDARLDTRLARAGDRP